MKIAITGGTGFVGRNLACALTASGHEVVIIARRPNQMKAANSRLFSIGLDDTEKLAQAFSGCDAVAHCAGINREIGTQTYERVHVQGTRNVVSAARQAGLRKIILISFLRARPDCGSAYHETKFAAEEIVRQSGLDYTIFKCGVIYGRGDHMLDHLSHAFHTFPVFAFVGFKDKLIRPNAVEDVARIVKSSLVDGALSRRTVAVLGPEILTLRQAVLRVAGVVGRRPLAFPMPVWFHHVLGWVVEKIMTVPLVSVAQVRMLSEGLAEPWPPCDHLPDDLAPQIRFSEEQIRKGLPPAAPFRLSDLRCCQHQAGG
ncbi:MAG TPA: NAD(P)H-binding protein [Verrucomicrobiae bacterium]|nr:NAD(P)H-binding protein [Verrucomicrobiae bacterium]